MNAKMLYAAAKAAGLEVDNHNSDLYIKVSGKARALINNYEYKNSVTTFNSSDGSGLWFEVPFAFEPFWENAERTVEGWAKVVSEGSL